MIRLSNATTWNEFISERMKCKNDIAHSVSSIQTCPVCGQKYDPTSLTANGDRCRCTRFERMQRLENRLIDIGYAQRIDTNHCFRNDVYFEPSIRQMAENYVCNFQEHMQKNVGIFLFGTVGTGKSFLAECIGNDLKAQRYSVMMTKPSGITAYYGNDNLEMRISAVKGFDLIILDDYGSERLTEFAMEQMFRFIDDRLKARLPVIITSNLTRSEMESDDIQRKRINDRILWELCPIKIGMNGTHIREIVGKGHSKTYDLHKNM